MMLGSWLFVGGRRSRLVEVVDPLTLAVRGPGTRRQVLRFASEDDLIAGALAIEHRLKHGRWTLLGFNSERRKKGASRIDGQERRRP